MISDLQLKVASEYAVIGLQKHMAGLKYFCHNFRELEAQPGASIAVPVYNLSGDAADFNSESNNWTASETVDGVTVSLDKHIIRTIGLDDVTANETDINFLRDATIALTENIAHTANKYTMGVAVTGASTTAEVDLSSKQDFADLFAVAENAGVNPFECNLVLDPASYAKCLGSLDFAVYGGENEAVRAGIIPQLFSFRSVQCSPYLGAGVKGLIVPYNTLGIVSRVNKPAINGYLATFVATDESSGLSLGGRIYEDVFRGKMVAGMDLLFSAKTLQNGIIKLV